MKLGNHCSVNEERLPSITTILKATESEEKESFSSSLEKQRVGQKRKLKINTSEKMYE